MLCHAIAVVLTMLAADPLLGVPLVDRSDLVVTIDRVGLEKIKTKVLDTVIETDKANLVVSVRVKNQTPAKKIL